MSAHRFLWVKASLLTLALFLLVVMGSLALLWLNMDLPERLQIQQALSQRWPLLLLPLVLLTLVVIWLWQQLVVRYVHSVHRLHEQVSGLISAAQGARLARPLPEDVAAVSTLREAINGLAAERDRWRSDVDAQVVQASERVQQEKNRLAALISELSVSVVVCNLDGRILLFNNRARLQCRVLSGVTSVASGAEWMGIGRSIYAVLDRAMLSHGLEKLQQRLARGAAHPATQFLTTTPSGQVLRVHMAPVRQQADAVGLSGFVLMLDNVTQGVAQDNQRTQQLLQLADDLHTSLGKVQVTMQRLPTSDERQHIADQVGAMQLRVEQLVAHAADELKTRWPLEDMLAADLLLAAQRGIGQTQLCEAVLTDVSAHAWVKVDSFGLVQVLTYLACRLADEFDVKSVQLRCVQDQQDVYLDVLWFGHAMSTETVMGWELDEMRVGHLTSPLTVRDVLLRHGAALSFERERSRHAAYFRISLRASHAQEFEATKALRSDSRPEFYDFDLFQESVRNDAIENRLLSSLTYTVFDTETTGLRPDAGDQIIQIGATRIVNGRLLRADAFEQLVDPGRRIPDATIPIHGITQDMVQGQPRIHQVLPAFHAYAADTVLVAHNAAFDMKFLQLQESATGLKFDHPVLDTLMLSAVIQPNQTSHRLEAIAERLNIPVLGRHTALGDALVTAEVFLCMLPLLAEKGIHTFGQARAAAQQTYYARLKY